MKRFKNSSFLGLLKAFDNPEDQEVPCPKFSEKEIFSAPKIDLGVVGDYIGIKVLPEETRSPFPLCVFKHTVRPEDMSNEDISGNIVPFSEAREFYLYVIMEEKEEEPYEKTGFIFIQPKGLDTRYVGCARGCTEDLSRFIALPGYPKGSFMRKVSEAYCGVGFSVAMIACQILNCSNISLKDVHPPEKLQSKRIKKGKEPYYSYKVIHINNKQKPKDGEGSSGTEYSVRFHFVRGHVRRLSSGKTTWVTAHSRGHGGFSDHDYEV